MAASDWMIKRSEGYSPKRYWERTDGAYVWYDDKSPHPNPINPRCRMWVAFHPEGSTETYLARRNRKRPRRGGRSRMIEPRRFKTPEAAMKAYDKEFPLDGRLDIDARNEQIDSEHKTF